MCPPKIILMRGDANELEFICLSNTNLKQIFFSKIGITRFERDLAFEARAKNTRDRTRTYNLPLRRRTPYPLGHTGFVGGRRCKRPGGCILKSLEKCLNRAKAECQTKMKNVKCTSINFNSIPNQKLNLSAHHLIPLL